MKYILDIMELTKQEIQILDGKHGKAARKCMEILIALGEIYGAKRLIDIKSVQISGVSYDNLGEAGLEFLEEMAVDGKVKVYSTLNPAGMDLNNWKSMGISDDFAVKQKRVIDAFVKMGVNPTCSCTPYLIGNKPGLREHIAWSESSAVCYANSIVGAMTNREGGPSALASALTGKTAEYGYHLLENRKPKITVQIDFDLEDIVHFGALGYVIGRKLGNKIPLIKGIKRAVPEQLRSFCASIATYGGSALFHIDNITPEKFEEPDEKLTINFKEIENAIIEMNNCDSPDFIAIGCPHCSIEELDEIASFLKEKKVVVETWIATSRLIKIEAEKRGIIDIIEKSGAKVIADTCFVVAPIKGRFSCMATNSAKAVFYARGKNSFKTIYKPINVLINMAVKK